MIYEKIAKAIEFIKNSSLKKEGENTFSKYKYYTPEQVSKLVYDACKELKLLTRFDLERNEYGIVGKLTIIDITNESDNEVTYTMASAIPEIKATNIAQQLGGAMTYTKRYMLMNVFDIVDNNLDFDTTENTKKQVEQPKKETLTPSHDQFIKAKAAIENGSVTKQQAIDKLIKVFNLTPEIQKQL